MSFAGRVQAHNDHLLNEHLSRHDEAEAREEQIEADLDHLQFIGDIHRWEHSNGNWYVQHLDKDVCCYDDGGVQALIDLIL